MSQAETTEARMAWIHDRLARTTPDDPRTRVMLVLAHELVRQHALIRQLAAEPAVSGETVAATSADGTDYSRLIERIEAHVREAVPIDATILVIARGDDRLLFTGYRASHFPQGPGGEYAGHYPRDSEAAVAHLDDCHGAGAEFLVIPGTSYWWLDYYSDLARHLLARGRVVNHDADCLIFQLNSLEQGVAG